MWHGAFSDSDFKAIYEDKNKFYKNELLRVYESEQKRYLDQPPVGRLFIDSMDEMQNRLDLKLTRLKKDGYRFVNNPQREKLIAEKGSHMLLTQIMINIKDREARGINQEETKLLLKKLATEGDQEDNVTIKKAERLYKELLIEANA